MSGKEPTCQCKRRGDVGSIPGSWRSPGGGEAMKTHSSVLAWRIPWTEEPGRLQSMRSQRVRHGWNDLAHTQGTTPPVQFCSVAQSCPILCDPTDCSKPGLPVYHQLLEFTQIHVHWVGDAIQPSHSLSSPSPPAFNLSQHQGLFQWVSSLHQVARVLEFQLQQLQREGLLSLS